MEECCVKHAMTGFRSNSRNRFLIESEPITNVIDCVTSSFINAEK